MTREMNKPDWHEKWLDIHTQFLNAEKLPIVLNTGSIQGQRRMLDEWIKPFVDSINERFKQ